MVEMEAREFSFFNSLVEAAGCRLIQQGWKVKKNPCLSVVRFSVIVLGGRTEQCIFFICDI